MRDISIIAEGAGLHSAFVAGVLYQINQIVDDFKFSNVSTYFASSSSLENILYFLSDETGETVRNIWLNDNGVSDVGLMTGSTPLESILKKKVVIDVDHLVDNIFKIRYPLNIDLIKKSKSKIFAPVYNVSKSKTEVFLFNDDSVESFDFCGEKHDVILTEGLDMYECIRATNAVPILYDKLVEMNGDKYNDGAVTMPFALGFSDATRNTKKILILPDYGTVFDKLLYYTPAGIVTFMMSMLGLKDRKKARVYLNIAKKAFVHNKLMKNAKKMQEAGELIIIKPSVPISGTFDGTKKGLEHNFFAGVDESKKMQKEIINFLL